MTRALKMRSFLDENEDRTALELARQLMKSKDRAARLEVVAVLGWLGRRALPELTEMLADRDNFVQTLAQNNWSVAFDALSTDKEKAAAIRDAVGVLGDDPSVNEFLIKLCGLQSDSALSTLEEIIVGYNGKAASTQAKAMFEHLAGEPWSSLGRTQKLSELEKRKSEGKL